MLTLSWELSILSRAVQYENLSGASAHVGLSQPQLSRIIAKLEKTYGVVLLDRKSKRHTSWSANARRISDLYLKTSRVFEDEIRAIETEAKPREIRIAFLEGLMPLAVRLIEHLYRFEGIQFIEANVYDIGLLEERFARGVVDLVLTFREPGRKKYQYVKTLGYQTIDAVKGSGSLQIMSPFEYGQFLTKGSKQTQPVFVSNSLSLRQQMTEGMRASALMPSSVRKNRQSSKDITVIAIANDAFHEAVWKHLTKFQP